MWKLRSGSSLRSADKRCQRWIVSKKFHHIRTGDDEKWPILRISYPPIINGKFAGELSTFDETRPSWSRHQLIVPDPFVPTHVCYLPPRFLLKVDGSPRITHSMCIEARYTTFLCWQKPAYRFCAPPTRCILYLVPTTNRSNSLSNAVAVPHRPQFGSWQLVMEFTWSGDDIFWIYKCGQI